MRIGNSTPEDVKSKGGKKTRTAVGKITASDVRDRRTFKLFIRFQGYLHGAFIRRSRGRLRYLDWNPLRFHRRTKREVGLRTIERQFPRFQRWCEEYRFEKVSVRGRWVVRVTPNLGVALAVPGATIRDRLEAAIRTYVGKGGRCKVDRVFCMKFADLSGLPLVAVETLWLRMGKLPGLKCRWRGVGRGRKLVVEDPARWREICAERAAPKKSENLRVSDPQTSPPVSIPSGRKIEKQRTGGPDPENRPLAPLAVGAEGLAWDETDGFESANPEPGGNKSPPTPPRFGRSPTGAGPLQICGRFISLRKTGKLSRLAGWLAGARLRRSHLNRDRVRFLFVHARNFAFRALVAGYRSAAIESAYARGIDRSHEDALCADKIGLDGAGFPVFGSQRMPSAAVVYAWGVLRAKDPRTPEELWAEFFAAPRAPVRPAAVRKPRAGKADAVETPAPGTPRPRLTAAQAIGFLADMRKKMAARDAPDPVESVDQAPEVTAGDVWQYLHGKGMTAPQFGMLSWRDRQALIARVAAEKKAAKISGVDKPTL